MNSTSMAPSETNAVILKRKAAKETSDRDLCFHHEGNGSDVGVSPDAFKRLKLSQVRGYEDDLPDKDIISPHSSESSRRMTDGIVELLDRGNLLHSLSTSSSSSSSTRRVKESSSCNTANNTGYSNFHARFEELTKYKEQFGNCLVPKKSTSHPQLGIWVMNQRAQYKLMQQNKPSTITPERIQALEELGFVWSVCDHVDWEERLNELRDYISKFGHCLVPYKFSDNQQLGTWVNKQRTQYKLMMEGSPSSMTPDRARALEALGFVWFQRDLVDWYSRLEDLKQYKQQYGDCLVPNKYAENPPLGTWVMHQRAQYRKLREGKPSPMTEERVEALESIGFVWSISKITASADWKAQQEDTDAICVSSIKGCKSPTTDDDNESKQIVSSVVVERASGRLSSTHPPPKSICTLRKASETFATTSKKTIRSELKIAELDTGKCVGREEICEDSANEVEVRDSVRLSSSDEHPTDSEDDVDDDYMLAVEQRNSHFRGLSNYAVRHGAITDRASPISNASSSSNSTTALSGKLSQTYDDTWKVRFNDLVAYKEQYGDCLVPKKSASHPQLGIWVMNQRAQYKLLQENKPSTMTSERIEALEGLDFVWSMCDHVDWEERLEELYQYKNKHGDCLVPNKYADNPQLGTWVNKQRTQYKRMMEGNPSSMTPERARALERLGFVWSKRDLVDWYSRLDELKLYKQQHGDCLVPNKYYPNPQLGTWVMHQRAQYRKLREGKPSPMTEERVKALEAIGFFWSTSNTDLDWSLRMEDLKAYKAQHGHCLVPNRYPENPKLGTWVGKQRKQYKLRQDGKSSCLTEQRIQELDELDFVWSLRSLVDWDERLEELKEYRELHGNCLVPQQYPENPQLGTWVSNQRKQFRLRMEGKASPMTEERVQKLTKIGFVWSIFTHDTQRESDSSGELEKMEPEQRKLLNKEMLTRAREVVLLLSLSQAAR